LMRSPKTETATEIKSKIENIGKEKLENIIIKNRLTSCTTFFFCSSQSWWLWLPHWLLAEVSKTPSESGWSISCWWSLLCRRSDWPLSEAFIETTIAEVKGMSAFNWFSSQIEVPFRLTT
jgi:hypothetical protein